MITRRALGGLAALAPLPGLAQGSAFPNRPVKLVVPYTPGGSVDLMARAFGTRWSPHLGQPVITENRPGASTMLATQFVARSEPDGYTVLSGGTQLALMRHLGTPVPYDAERDLTAVAVLTLIPYLLVVNAALPVRTVPELIAYMRARPGAMSYASFGVGGAGHLAAEMFNMMAGTQTLHVPYNGSPQAMTDTIAGRTDCMPVLLAAGRAQIEAGRLRPLGISNPARSDTLPGLPTIAEQGFPGFGMAGWYSLQLPAGTPEPIAAAIRRGMAAGLADEGTRRLMATNGLTPTAPADQGEAPLRARIAAELEQHRELLARAGVVPE